MSYKYTPVEYTNMHFIYGFCKGNARKAAEVYRERYPNARHPDHRVFIRVHSALSEGRFPGTGVGGVKEGRPQRHFPPEDEVEEESDASGSDSVADSVGRRKRRVPASAVGVRPSAGDVRVPGRGARRRVRAALPAQAARAAVARATARGRHAARHASQAQVPRGSSNEPGHEQPSDARARGRRGARATEAAGDVPGRGAAARAGTTAAHAAHGHRGAAQVRRVTTPTRAATLPSALSV